LKPIPIEVVHRRPATDLRNDAPPGPPSNGSPLGSVAPLATGEGQQALPEASTPRDDQANPIRAAGAASARTSTGEAPGATAEGPGPRRRAERSERKAPIVLSPEQAHRVLAALEWATEATHRSDEAAAVAFPAHLPRPSPDDFLGASQAFPSDVRRVLDTILTGRNAEAGLDALLACGALAGLFPEVEAMVGFGDGEWRHKDVWKHTKQVVRQAVPRLEVRWAALLHDIGKLRTRSISPTGEVHFFGHAEVGARMFDRIDRRMPLFTPEPALRDRVRFLILHHLRASQYDGSWTDSAVRRFTKEMGDALQDLLCLSRADITTKRPEKKKRGLRQISELDERVEAVRQADAVVPPLPSGIGDELVRELGIPPSRKIGELKHKLEAAVEAGDIEPHLPVGEYLAFLRAHPARFGLE
jgi:poly(A) polymerase